MSIWYRFFHVYSFLSKDWFVTIPNATLWLAFLFISRYELHSGSSIIWFMHCNRSLYSVILQPPLLRLFLATLRCVWQYDLSVRFAIFPRYLPKINTWNTVPQQSSFRNFSFSYPVGSTYLFAYFLKHRVSNAPLFFSHLSK